MRSKESFQTTRLSGAALILISTCLAPDLGAQHVQIGDSVSYSGGFAYVWIETDDDQVPVNVGITLDSAVVYQPGRFFRQNWPEFPDAGKHSLFTNVLFDWNPNGHAPANYSRPHFDFHFDMVPRFVMDNIQTGEDTVPVEPDLIPPNYEPDTDPPVAIENMGVHYVDKSSREWNGDIFTETLVWGYYRGDLFFIEPMITQSYLYTVESEAIPIKQPARYARPGYYPTTYKIERDRESGQYHVVLTDFVNTAVVSTEEQEIPNSVFVSQNFPNPAEGRTRIRYGIEDYGRLKLEVFDILGRRVATLVDEAKAPGVHEVAFDASRLESGVYVYRLSSGPWTRMRMMHVVHK